MRILYYNEGEDPDEWLPELKAALPEAEIRLWQAHDHDPADYALVWNPPAALFQKRTGLKAIFNLGAGVDSLLALKNHFPPGIPVFRLKDAGMAIQMAEYAVHAVLRYFRRFDEYEKITKKKRWEMLAPYKREDFTIGIMGMGIMGTAIANALKPFGFPLRGWRRNKKEIPDVTCYGNNELQAFLKKVRILICTLPLTEKTIGILNLNTFRSLQQGAYLINLGRGAHLVEKDLVTAMETGLIKAATLDVLQEEPPSPAHPFWTMDNITLTPHIGALTFCQETVKQVAIFIHAIEAGKMPTSPIDTAEGY